MASISSAGYGRSIPVTVPIGVHGSNLAAFRTPAREPTRVKPVAEDVFWKTVEVLPDPWKSVAILQWYTGMRPCEACELKRDYLDRSGELWTADYGVNHKTAYKGRERVIILGKRSQDVLRAWIERAVAAGRDYVFWVTRSRRSLSVSGYGHAVARYCAAAGLPHWHPNQIRHTFLTRVRARYGLEEAQIAAGHARADVTQVYAEANLALAEKVAREMG